MVGGPDVIPSNTLLNTTSYDVFRANPDMIVGQSIQQATYSRTWPGGGPTTAALLMDYVSNDIKCSYAYWYRMTPDKWTQNIMPEVEANADSLNDN